MKQHQQNESLGQSNAVDLALMAKDISSIQKDVSEIRGSLKSDYVYHNEFIDLKDTVHTLDNRFWAAIVLAITSLVSAITTLLVLIGRKP